MGKIAISKYIKNSASQFQPISRFLREKYTRQNTLLPHYYLKQSSISLSLFCIVPSFFKDPVVTAIAVLLKIPVPL